MILRFVWGRGGGGGLSNSELPNPPPPPPRNLNYGYKGWGGADFLISFRVVCRPLKLVHHLIPANTLIKEHVTPTRLAMNDCTLEDPTRDNYKITEH